MAIIAEFDLAIREAESPAEPDQFLFCGETFTVAGVIGSLPMMRLAHGMHSDAVGQMEFLGLGYALLKSVVAPEDWERFASLATARGAQFRDLTRIAYKIYAVQTARPTVRSSVSSDGPPTTTEILSPDSSSLATAPASNVPPGRPDLAVPMISVEELVDGDS